MSQIDVPLPRKPYRPRQPEPAEETARRELVMAAKRGHRGHEGAFVRCTAEVCRWNQELLGYEPAIGTFTQGEQT